MRLGRQALCGEKDEAGTKLLSGDGERASAPGESANCAPMEKCKANQDRGQVTWEYAAICR